MNRDFAAGEWAVPIDLARESNFALGRFIARPSLCELSTSGGTESVEPRVMQALVALVQRGGAVVSRDELIQRCWNRQVVADDAINRCVAKVRKLAELDSGASFRVETIPRVGYRLVEIQNHAGKLFTVEPVEAPRVSRRLRIYLSSPSDVRAAREIAALTIERLVQDYARFVAIEPYLWEYEAMVASGRFQDPIELPSLFDIVVLILGSRLGTILPERTTLREYRGIDGRTPITETEWAFEEALGAAQRSGAPDLLVYRSRENARAKSRDLESCQRDFDQLSALDQFWSRNFVDRGPIGGACAEFAGGAEFAAVLENHLRGLIEKRIATGASDHGDSSATVWSGAPFRGLEAYEFEHSPIFFGQDEALAKAMVQLAASAEAGSPFLLVLGASGSGKSSLVKAGIVPRLFVRRRIPGVAFLRRVVFQPSDARDDEDLFDAFARRLVTQTTEHEGLSELVGPGQTPSRLAAHLRNATAEPAYPIRTALGQIATGACQDGRMLEYENPKLVLVVDQLEELFTNDRIAADERQRFIDLLAGLVRSDVVWIVATMRKDFWHRADETPELVRMSEGNCRLELLPPSPSQLSQMIRRPAEAAGVSFEYRGPPSLPLNEVLADEVAHEPGALPLLSYLLDQLYCSDVLEAHRRLLSYATYERLGKLGGAIATKAESVLDRCAPEDRQALRSVLFSLVQMGTSAGDVGRAIARRVPLSTFPPGTPQRRLVDALLSPDARLLVSDAEEGQSPTVRVAHEALIGRWAEARDFVQDNAEALKIRRRIEERYTMWRDLNDRGRDTPNVETKISTPLLARLTAWCSRSAQEKGLLSEIDLTDGQRLLLEHRSDAAPHLVAYIENSVAHDKRIRTRSFRALAIVASVVAVLAVFASAAGLIASNKQHEAEAQTEQALGAQARLLTEAASEHLNDLDVSGAQGIILEVLTNPKMKQARPATAIKVFQEIRALDAELGVLSGHGDGVLSAAYSPNGMRIVTASADKTARIWDASTGHAVTILSGHGAAVRSAAWSFDGKRIVTASDDKTARIWNASTGVQIAMISGHDARVYSAAWSPDDERVVTASNDGTARIWDATTGAQLKVLSGHSGRVYSAAYSPDGRRIVTASSDKTARIWDAVTGQQLGTLSGHHDLVFSAAWSPDGKRVVTASDDRTARIWDADTGAQLEILSGHADSVSFAAWSPDGKRIVTASNDRTARIWDATTGAQLGVLSGHNDLIFYASWSPDGKRIVTASVDKTARIWDGSTGSELAVLPGYNARVYTVSYSPDCKRIVTASDDKTARIWNANSGRQLAVLSGHRDLVFSAAWSPDDKRVVTASADWTARIWDAVKGAELAALSGHHGAILSAAYSPSGMRVLTVSADRTIRVWDASKASQITVLSGHGFSFSSAGWSPDGRRIISTLNDNTVRVWDAITGGQLVVLSGNDSNFYSAAYSPDGRRIVTASADKTARIFDARTGAQLSVLSGHRDVVTFAAWSPDGRHIVTASDDKTARIWDVATGTLLAVLRHGGHVRFAAYSPDGSRIVTASDDKIVRIWDARVSADLDAQIMWNKAAEFDPLSDVERTQLGLPRVAHVRNWQNVASKCDFLASAPYDPNRLAQGVVQEEIVGDIASSACAGDIAKSKGEPRLVYEMGRGLLAKRDALDAKRQFELAILKGYRSARIDLANLLVDASAPMLDPSRAVLLYEQAWEDGVPVAAFELGHLYEHGVHDAGINASIGFYQDPSKAWSWYRRGAYAGEPNALARLAEYNETTAVAERSELKRDALLLKAFAFYAAAAERAQNEDWPDDAWRNWRYRRATLARLLARDGLMQRVAETFTKIRAKWRPNPPTLWDKIEAWLGEQGAVGSEPIALVDRS